MKAFKKIICLAAACVLTLTPFSGAAENGAVTATGESGIVLKNGDYTLTVDEETCSFALKSADGGVWLSNPATAGNSRADEVKSLLVLETVYSDSFEAFTYTSYYECVESGDYTVTRNGNSVDFVFDFTEIKTTVPLSLTLEKDGLRAELKIDEITVEDENVFLKSVWLLPYFGAAESQEEGYLFVPDGSGALIDFGKTNAKQGYSADVYGGDLADETADTLNYESITMPVFGIKKQSGSMLAVITDGEADCSLVAFASGQRTGFANAYARVNLGKSAEFDIGINKTTIFEEMPVKNKNVVLKYSVIPGDTTYVDMAKHYADYLENECGFERCEKKAESLFLDVWAGVVEKKSAFFFTYNGYTVLTTEEQLREMAAELTEAGVENLKIRYLGAVRDEAFSRITDKIEISSRLRGANGDFEGGVQVYPTVESFMTYTNENYIFSRAKKGVKSIADITVRLDGYTDAFGNTVGKERYILSPEELVKSLDSVTGGVKKNKTEYIGISDIGNTLYTNYGENPLKQDGLKDKIAEKLKALSQSTKISMEDPNVYAAVYAESIVGAPLGSSEYDVFTESVPFWQIVMSRFTEYGGNILNNGYTQRDILKLIETGTSARFVAVAENSEIPVSTPLSRYYSADFGVWRDRMTEVYAQLAAVNELTEGSAIEKHTRIAENVYLTEFENGAKIYVNYGTEAYTLQNGQTVGPEDYLGGEGK